MVKGIKTNYNVIITGNENETLIDVGQPAETAVNAVINVLQKNKEMLSKHTNFSVSLYIEDDSKN